MLENEFGEAPHGSEYSYYASQSMDPKLSKWTNLLALAVFPLLFHALASLFTYLHTRPQSFWGRFDTQVHNQPN